MEKKELTDEKWFEEYARNAHSMEEAYCEQLGWGGTNDDSVEMEIEFDRRLIAYVHSLQNENNRLSQKAIELEVETNNQKAEIERLTEEHKKDTMLLYASGLACEQVKAENTELQKQVDELKEQRDVFKNLFENCNNSSITTEEIINAMNSFYREQAEHLAKLKIEQAVKDTAKEVHGQALEWIPIWGGYQKFVDDFEGWLKERYGVEVE